MTMERSPQPYVRLAGILYLAIIALGVFGEAFVRGSLVVPGDATATAQAIAASESLWRAGIGGDLLMHVFDVVYHIKPTFYPAGVATANLWLDVAAIIGPVGVFLGLMVRKLGSAPIVPIGDPRLHEALHHKNPV